MVIDRIIFVVNVFASLICLYAAIISTGGDVYWFGGLSLLNAICAYYSIRGEK